MARGVNKVILIGHVGKDPEVRQMPNGNAVTTLSLATSESWKDKQTGEKQDRTEWHRIVFFNRLGELAGEYVKKGSAIYVEGSLRTRKWQDQQGQDRYMTEIVAAELQFLDSKGQQSSGFQPQPPLSAYQDAEPAYGNHSESKKSAPEMAAAHDAFDGLDDDIPF